MSIVCTVMLAAFLLLAPKFAVCQQGWKGHVAQLAEKLAKENIGDHKVYLNEFQNVATTRGTKGCISTYTFTTDARCALRTALTNSGLNLQRNAGKADAYLVTWFSVTDKGLNLECEVVKADMNSTVLAASSVLIPNSLLPPGWDKMTLEDIAYEVVVKMQPLLFNKGVKKIAMGSFTGGTKEQDGLTSEFSERMRTHVRNQLVKITDCSVSVAPDEQDKLTDLSVLAASDDQYFAPDVYVVKGEYVLSGPDKDKDVKFDLTLLGGKDKREIVGAVSHTFPISWVPANMRHKLTPVQSAPNHLIPGKNRSMGSGPAQQAAMLIPG